MELTLLTVPACPNAAAFEERLAAALGGPPGALVGPPAAAAERTAPGGGVDAAPPAAARGGRPVGGGGGRRCRPGPGGQSKTRPFLGPAHSRTVFPPVSTSACRVAARPALTSRVRQGRKSAAFSTLLPPRQRARPAPIQARIRPSKRGERIAVQRRQRRPVPRRSGRGAGLTRVWLPSGKAA